MAENRQVVLVDKNDQILGDMDVHKAHQSPGTLHRAISVILWRNGENGKEVLLQKRSAHKPLWPGYWTDTCSTHQVNGEGDKECAARRLKEEMGIEVDEDDLKVLEKMYYRADYNEELSEHELDSIIIGKYSDGYELNPSEVEEAKWVGVKELREDIKVNPDKYATWFRYIMDLESVGGELR